MAGLDKKSLTERDICTKFITPALVGPDGTKWNAMTQLQEEHYFTRGRVIVRGKSVRRGEANQADHLLFYKPNIPIASIEAHLVDCMLALLGRQDTQSIPTYSHARN